MCLQETKCNEKSLPAEITSMPEFPHKYWLSAEKDGYSGVAMLCKTEPINVTYGIGEEPTALSFGVVLVGARDPCPLPLGLLEPDDP